MFCNKIISDRYLDSVLLMSLAQQIKALPGITDVSLVMGTRANKALLQNAGILDDQGAQATSQDIIVALVGTSSEAFTKAYEHLEQLLNTSQAAPQSQDEEFLPKSLPSAYQRLSGANLAVISLPGEYVYREARKALQLGLHVFIFSDNVPLEHEIALKQMAQERGLLVMGPDCGTAIINGVAVGFANRVRRGGVGIAGASGTGIQEISVRLHQLGGGVSQAIGTGGRDLSAQVGGLSMLAALAALQADEQTRIIIIVSKPPAPEVAAKILQAARGLDKPVIVHFVGGAGSNLTTAGLTFAPTLEATAALALGQTAPALFTDSLSNKRTQATALAAELRPEQQYIRGLFSGGTLCEEALFLLSPLLPQVYSNVAPDSQQRIAGDPNDPGHTLVDLGDDRFTQGRPHPMIDYTLRAQRIIQAAEDPHCALILLDVVLGYGSHPDPAAALCPAIEQARAQARSQGRHLIFVASVCGTDQDPQPRANQVEQLEQVGVHILDSNAQAARFAALVVTRGQAQL